MSTALERKFDYLWRVLGGPELETEYRFHKKRRWRFDRAIPDQRIGIEIEGGTWGKGRHNREPGFTKDCEKYNTAARLGWKVYRFTGLMLDSPDKYIKPIIEDLSL